MGRGLGLLPLLLLVALCFRQQQDATSVAKGDHGRARPSRPQEPIVTGGGR